MDIEEDHVEFPFQLGTCIICVHGAVQARSWPVKSQQIFYIAILSGDRLSKKVYTPHPNSIAPLIGLTHDDLLRTRRMKASSANTDLNQKYCFP